MLPGMALNHLTESERDAILNVLQRDDQLRQKEQQRISAIQSSVKLLRLKGVIRAGQDATKTCARCRVSFGWFFNKGAICVQCQHKVCEACRHLQEDKTWLCSLCFKQMETAAKTGEWFYSKFRKSKRNKRTSRIVTGSEIIRSSIRRPSRSSVASNAASSVSEEVKRALTNNNAPLWRMDESEEKTETPAEATPPTAGQPTFMAAFPRESDTQKLLQLIRPRAPNTPTGSSPTQMHIRLVSTQRYKDSDSSSDSEDEAAQTSSVLPCSSHSSPVPSSSIASSDGWVTVVTDNVSDLDIATCSSNSSNSPPRSSTRWNEEHQLTTGQADPWSSSRSTGSSSGTIEECPEKTLVTPGVEQLSSNQMSPSLKSTHTATIHETSHTDTVSQESATDDTSEKSSSDVVHTVLPPMSESGTDEAEDRVTPVPTITIIQAKQRSLQSDDDEEDDDIDECFQTHASFGHNGNKNLTGYHGSNLLTPFSTSTESMLSFYSDAGEGHYGKIPVTGEIRFGLQYNYKIGALHVMICECRDLAPVDTKRKRSDPYVKTYLLPDKTKNGKRKTRVKKHTLNPGFDEVLKYNITKSELESRTLWITVWHNDRFGRNDFLGEVTLPLDYYQFGEGTPEWYSLKDRNTLPMSLLTYKGDLIISLKYVSVDKQTTPGGGRRNHAKGSLHVLVKQARNLTAVRSNGSSDPFCKGYLWPDKSRHAKQKSAVIKRDCNPCWNHTFLFDEVSWEELRERCLELTVWDHDRFTSNDFLGGVRLNLGAGSSAGKEVDWMDAKGEEISIWQSMLDRPNYWIDANLLLRPNMEKRK